MCQPWAGRYIHHFFMDFPGHAMLIGGLEHLLFSPIVGMMIQSDFHIFQGG